MRVVVHQKILRNWLVIVIPFILTSCLKKNLAVPLQASFKIPASPSCRHYGYSENLDTIADSLHDYWREESTYLARLKPVLDLNGTPLRDFKTYQELLGSMNPVDSVHYIDAVDSQGEPALYENIKELAPAKLAPNNRRESCDGAAGFFQAFASAKPGSRSEMSYARQVILGASRSFYERNSQGQSQDYSQVLPRFKLQDAKIARKLWADFRTLWLNENPGIEAVSETIEEEFQAEVEGAEQELRAQYSSIGFEDFLWNLAADRTGYFVFGSDLLAEVSRQYLNGFALSDLQAPREIERLDLVSQAFRNHNASDALSKYISSKLIEPFRVNVGLSGREALKIGSPSVAPGSGAFVASISGNRRDPASIVYLKIQAGSDGGLEEAITSKAAELTLSAALGSKPIDGSSDYVKVLSSGRLASGLGSRDPKMQSLESKDIYAIATNAAPGESVENWIERQSKRRESADILVREAATMGRSIGRFLREFHRRLRGGSQAKSDLTAQAEAVANASYDIVMFSRRVLGVSGEAPSPSAKNLGSIVSLRSSRSLSAARDLDGMEEQLRDLLESFIFQLVSGSMETGYSHGDLHTGNLFVDPGSAGQCNSVKTVT